MTSHTALMRSYPLWSAGTLPAQEAIWLRPARHCGATRSDSVMEFVCYLACKVGLVWCAREAPLSRTVMNDDSSERMLSSLILDSRERQEVACWRPLFEALT
eukprot:5180728-Amphidinium_carterae.1